MIAKIRNVYVRRTVLVIWCFTGEIIALAAVLLASAIDHVKDAAPVIRSAWRGPAS